MTFEFAKSIACKARRVLKANFVALQEPGIVLLRTVNCYTVEVNGVRHIYESKGTISDWHSRTKY